MKLEYDPEANAVYVRFADDRIVETEEVQPGIIFDSMQRGESWVSNCSTLAPS